MRALITGVGGFVGRYLAGTLSRAGIECFGTTYSESENVNSFETRTQRIDVRDRSTLAEYLRFISPDYVVHLAAISDVQSGRDFPALAFDVNVGGTVNVLEAVRLLRKRPRVLIVSTGAVYGDHNSGDEGFSEDEVPMPNSTYAASKYISEQVSSCYARDHGIDVVVARPFNHTGPGQSATFVCSSFAKQLAEGNGREVVIRVGSLLPRRDFSDVRDVVSAYKILLERGESGETYNVSSGKTVSIGEVLALLVSDAHVIARAEVDATRLRSLETDRLGGNSSKLQRLGWTPTIPLTETLHDVLKFWRRKAKVAA